jgi:prevent-host-death family protein
MQTVNIYEAKTQLSKLVDLASSGTDVVIARAGKPVARLTSLKEKDKRLIGFGHLLEGKRAGSRTTSTRRCQTNFWRSLRDDNASPIWTRIFSAGGITSLSDCLARLSDL